ncbi:methyltransferase domain-containing protein [Paenibacillus albicereus]|uniref:Methyltransferase domain-containing protein n=1 Tax=Paenibacillus albicereus TaxID=2726185 RepID=A0A6H2GSR7_9BACL|nr:class I SAM-dependent methyltransferase [Paenibacillus albicereus]QJC50450.1 methyltransferase domain-containing protein [Paenibacillus albicereus]
MDGMLETILDSLGLEGRLAEVQRVQTAHRMRLAEFWAIREGARVLEIGCGQGDTTAVLACLVGPSGFVHGVDIAPPGYGAPMTVGEAAARLQQSRIGGPVRVEFGLDVLRDEVDFGDRAFDDIVFSHSSWYLQSPEQLERLLVRARRWGRRLCFAEWDPRISRIGQLPHLLAVLVQAQAECFKTGSEANVRTLLAPADITRIAKAAGWSVSGDAVLPAGGLQDGGWEVDLALGPLAEELPRLEGLPRKSRELLESQLGLLAACVSSGQRMEAMDSWVMTAV